MVTINVSDAFFAELKQIVATQGDMDVAIPPPTLLAPLLPPRIVDIPWASTSGLPNITIGLGETVTFRFTVPNGVTSNGRLGNFSISPTDATSYFDRLICLSDIPGEFSTRLGAATVKTGQEPNIYFSVNGYPITPFVGVNTTNANLVSGKTYYVNVRQVDPAKICKINYGLRPGT